MVKIILVILLILLLWLFLGPNETIAPFQGGGGAAAEITKRAGKQIENVMSEIDDMLAALRK